MKTDIILAGVGGQGILTIATIIGIAALEDNIYVKQAEVHGMSQRGGDVESDLRLSDKPIASDLIPKGKADLIVSMEPMEALRYTHYLDKGGWIVTNSKPFVNIEDYPEESEILNELNSLPNCLSYDFDKLSLALGNPRSANIILLGAASPFIMLPKEKLETAITKFFFKKGDKIIEDNLTAFNSGRELTISNLKI